MAIDALIHEMDARGIPATMELPGGKWCHTPEYLKVRYGGSGNGNRLTQDQRGELRTKRRMAQAARFDDALATLGKLTPSERMLLLAELEGTKV